jgi:hypothetical protein
VGGLGVIEERMIEFLGLQAGADGGAEDRVGRVEGGDAVIEVGAGFSKANGGVGADAGRAA